jgi:hypothetical protein
MTSLERALSHYENGRLTATGLVLETLQLVNAQNVDSILVSLPPDVVEVLKRFVDGYHSGLRVFNGPRPSEESVRIVRESLAEHTLLKGNA